MYIAPHYQRVNQQTTNIMNCKMGKQLYQCRLQCGTFLCK
jgi:hypothetical protein